MMSKSSKKGNRMKRNMDRRSFLIGGAAAGVFAAGGALVGCASNEEPKTSAQAEEAKTTEAPAAGNSAATAPIEPVAVPGSWDKEADIVIIGTGGGGLNAASRACQEGLTAIAIEKLSLPGGNTQSATMYTCPGNTELQNEAEIAIPSYPYEVDKWMDHIMHGLGQGGHPEILKLIAENIAPCYDWMTETYNLEWSLGFDGTFMQVQPVGMTKIIDAAYQYAQDNGAEFMMGTEALALVKDGDRIVGVKAKSSEEGEVYLHAKKAVLLMGGGFAANKDLLAEYCPSAVDRAASCYLAGTDTGECFRMGLGVGAGVIDNNNFTMFDGGMEWDTHGGEWCHYLYDGATQLVRQPWLSINRDGDRIKYINSIAEGALTDQATIETSQPGHRSYVLFDANWDEYLQTFGQFACRRPIQDGVDRQSYVPEYYQDYHAGVQDAMDAGLICKGETLEELAEALGLSPEVVNASVEKWNSMVATGHDDFAFPLKDEWLHPINTPPYYGAKIGGMIFMTSTGLDINDKLQVLGADGKVIPGLYAGWHTAGGAATPDRIGSMACDTGGVSKSYLGGYLAAKFVAEEE